MSLHHLKHLNLPIDLTVHTEFQPNLTSRFREVEILFSNVIFLFDLNWLHAQFDTKLVNLLICSEEE